MYCAFVLVLVQCSYDFCYRIESILVFFFQIQLLSYLRQGLDLAYFILFRTDPPHICIKKKENTLLYLLYIHTHVQQQQRASEQGARRGCGLGRIARFWTWTMKELHIISKTGM